MKVILYILIVLCAFLQMNSTLAFSQSIVVPNQFINQSDFPAVNVQSCDLFPNGTRGQVLYPANELGSGIITGISNRLFPGSSGFTPVTIPNITIKMSTTTKTASDLDLVFADNVGADEIIVYQGNLTVSALSCNTDPCPFLTPLKLMTPFTYDNTNGNLLVEYITPPCVGGIPSNVLYDATDTTLASVSSANSNSDQGGDVVFFGLITEFIFEPQNVISQIPTLSEWGLFFIIVAFGVIALLNLHRRKTTI